MTTTEQARVFSLKETAAAVRKELRATFPGHKISVRCSRGSSYIHADWIDGPTRREVEAVVWKYRDEVFDGQTDSYRQLPDERVVITPGEAPELVRWSCSGVLMQRQDSAEAIRETATAILSQNPHLLCGHPMPDYSTESVGNIVYQLTHTFRHTTNRSITYNGRSVGMEMQYLDNAADVLRYCLGTTARPAAN